MDFVARNVTAIAEHHARLVPQKRFFQTISAFLMRMFALMMVKKNGHYFKSLPKQKFQYATTVRVYAGSHPVEGDNWNLKGHAPDISLWTESGHKIGHALGKGQIIAQGAFLDMFVPHAKEIQSARPHYMNIITGGNDALCISGVEVTFPDGAGVTFTGDILKKCWLTQKPFTRSGKHLDGINPYSRTQMGFDNEPPACFWLDKDKSFPHLWLTALSIRLPDFAPTDEKAQEWNLHPERLCGPSPRLYFFESNVNQDTPVPIWMPPFEVYSNGTDVDIHRVEKWASAQREQRFSLHGRDLGASDSVELIDAPATLPLNQTLANQPRRLVKSYAANFSAVDKCYDGTNIGEDYVSMEEKVFCDMKLRNMWHLCDENFTEGCFDVESNMLRGFNLDTTTDGNDATQNDEPGVLDQEGNFGDDGADEIGNGNDEENEDPETLSSRIARRYAHKRLFRVPGSGNHSIPTATTDYGEAVYGMKYEMVHLLK